MKLRLFFLIRVKGKMSKKLTKSCLITNCDKVYDEDDYRILIIKMIMFKG